MDRGGVVVCGGVVHQIMTRKRCRKTKYDVGCKSKSAASAWLIPNQFDQFSMNYVYFHSNSIIMIIWYVSLVNFFARNVFKAYRYMNNTDWSKLDKWDPVRVINFYQHFC